MSDKTQKCPTCGVYRTSLITYRGQTRCASCLVDRIAELEAEIEAHEGPYFQLSAECARNRDRIAALEAERDEALRQIRAVRADVGKFTDAAAERKGAREALEKARMILNGQRHPAQGEDSSLDALAAEYAEREDTQ